jgi:hypothetical protein
MQYKKTWIEEIKFGVYLEFKTDGQGKYQNQSDLEK